MAILSKSILVDGRTIISLLPYKLVFSDGTIMAPCDINIVDYIKPKIEETDTVMNKTLNVRKIRKYLEKEQVNLLIRLQTEADLVILPRLVLDVLNEDPVNRVSAFSKCVGQKPTEYTKHLAPPRWLVDTERWMY